MQNFNLPTLNFNLRSAKTTKSSIIVVVGYQSRQIRFSSGVAVRPEQWNKREQRADFRKAKNRQDAKNIAACNKQLTQISIAFQEFCCNFADGNCSITSVRSLLNNNNMARPKKAETATALLIQALQKTTKNENTQVTKMAAIKSFEQFLNAKKMANSYTSFTENIIIQYHSWLTTQVASNTANNRASSVASLIKSIYTDERYITLNIPQPKPYKAIKDDRTKEDNKHTEILEDELQSIRNYTGIHCKYGWAFYLQCRFGVRKSDLEAAVQCGIEKDKGVHTIKTQKEKINAQINYTQEDVELCRRLKDFNGFRDNNFNYFLRKIAKNLNLQRQITYVHSNGEKKTEPLMNVISTHCARVTKATQLMRQGISKDIIIKMLAWSDTTMLDKIYSQLTTEDNEKQVEEALNQRTEAKNKGEISAQATQFNNNNIKDAHAHNTRERKSASQWIPVDNIGF